MTGAAPPRGFPAGEYADRTARAQSLMAAAGLDAMLLTTEPEIRYFSGFLTQFWQSPTRPWFLILPAAGKPVAVIPAIGAACMGATWVDDIRTWPSPAPADEGVSLLAATVAESVGPGGRLGVPMGAETHVRMPLADFYRLRDLLPGIAVADATDVVRTLRMVKSPAEIAKIGHICIIASDVFDGLAGHLRPGMSEIDIFRLFRMQCLAAGADDVAYLVGGAGPGGYGDIISPPSARSVVDGDVLILDTGAVFDGYYCDFDRNYAFGHADAAVERAHETLFEATEAGFRAAQPGAECRDVFRAMQAVLSGGDGGEGNAVGRLGHGLGMQLTEWPSLTADDATVIRPGMVLTLEPALAPRPDRMPGRIMVHEENIVVGADGPRWLSRRAPQRLPVIS
ncbi:Xaa-Pro peptidase family protein [Fodinicurvata sp. EGI_FJ10296]|uniref:M24 family metallopeptidase n=1 Tax=Fodinicurvata sp. EGI_FJ10296 TaxID=3231908 RepID=UPI003451E120